MAMTTCVTVVWLVGFSLLVARSCFFHSSVSEDWRAGAKPRSLSTLGGSSEDVRWRLEGPL